MTKIYLEKQPATIFHFWHKTRRSLGKLFSRARAEKEEKQEDGSTSFEEDTEAWKAAIYEGDNGSTQDDGDIGSAQDDGDTETMDVRNDVCTSDIVCCSMTRRNATDVAINFRFPV